MLGDEYNRLYMQSAEHAEYMRRLQYDAAMER